MYHIYRIVNNVNNCSYIGYTKQKFVMRRWSSHKNHAKNCGSFSDRRCCGTCSPMREYGIENFSFQILCWGENDDVGLRVVEPLMIEIFKPVYNQTRGGGGIHNWKHTLESLGKISGNKHYCFGKKLSESTKRLISEVKSNVPFSFQRKLKHREMFSSPYMKEMISRIRKDKSLYTTTCVCGKTGNSGNMHRWHIPKCGVHHNKIHRDVR